MVYGILVQYGQSVLNQNHWICIVQHAIKEIEGGNIRNALDVNWHIIVVVNARNMTGIEININLFVRN